MKTRYKVIIIAIVISIFLFVGMWIAQNERNIQDQKFMEKWRHERELLLDEIAQEKRDKENNIRNSTWTTGEGYCDDWCDQDELYAMGCDIPILVHLSKYSNLLDEEFDGTYWLEWIGLSDGMSKEKLEECVDFIYEKRIEMELTSGKIVTGSYELENPLCMGGRGMIVNEDCERIGKYDVSTGMPIVENKDQCDMLEGDWDEEQKICDSKYGGK